jgi:hypothetical protein
MNDRKFIRPILDASYQNKKDASKTLAKHGYTLDKKLSTNESKVFIDPYGKPNIAFRGSTNAKDFLFSDPLLAVGLGKYDPRLKQSQKLVQKVESKYNAPTDVFGHSLAGFLSEKSGAGGNVYTYNKAVGITDIGKSIPKNQTDIRSRNDIVSGLALTQKYDNGSLKTLKTPIFQSPIEAHKLKNLPDIKIV